MKKSKILSNPVVQQALASPLDVKRERSKRSLYYFVQYFWDTIIAEEFSDNWHIKYLCDEIQKVCELVFRREPKAYDLLINIPPGTTKSTICTVMAPVWVWSRMPEAKMITGSYSSDLSLEHADLSRDIIRSDKFKEMFPDLYIRKDKEQKSNYMNNKMGSRCSTSVGGTITGFHGHIIFVDDPINPKKAASTKELENANTWIDRTLSTRKVSKANTPIITIMQRLHENDPSGHSLAKSKRKKLKHICLPGILTRTKKKSDYDFDVSPPELKKFYVDRLLDPARMPLDVIHEMEEDLGQYGFAGQVLQSPTPPSGGMFKVENFIKVDVPPSPIVKSVRYWDKAGTDAIEKNVKAYTVGTLMHRLKNGCFYIEDVVREQFSTDKREARIKLIGEMDGQIVKVYIEQEPGSGGKESAQSTIRNLAGLSVEADRPTGDKVFRADPYSVQVNRGNIYIKKAPWNDEFLNEHRFFPLSTTKDQVDSAAGAFSKLHFFKRAGALRPSRQK